MEKKILFNRFIAKNSGLKTFTKFDKFTLNKYNSYNNFITKNKKWN